MTETTTVLKREEAVSPIFSEALRTWGRIGVLSFGGPAAQIALMHRIVVDEKRWLTEHPGETRFGSGIDPDAAHACCQIDRGQCRQITLGVCEPWPIHREGS